MTPQIFIDHKRIEAFCRKWRVREFYLFGSVLREDFGPDSDVDVLIKKDDFTGVGLDEWLAMIEELEAIFGRKTELVTTAGIRNPYIRREIAQTRLLIHAA